MAIIFIDCIRAEATCVQLLLLACLRSTRSVFLCSFREKRSREMCHSESSVVQTGKSCCCLSSSENSPLSQQYHLQIQTDQLFLYIDLSSIELDNRRELWEKLQLQKNTLITWHLCGAVRLGAVQSKGYTRPHYFSVIVMIQLRHWLIWLLIIVICMWVIFLQKALEHSDFLSCEIRFVTLWFA